MKSITPETLKAKYLNADQEDLELLIRDIYRHEKGRFYNVLELIKHKTEDGEWLLSVLYSEITDLNNSQMYSRDIETFCKKFQLLEDSNILEFEVPELKRLQLTQSDDKRICFYNILDLSHSYYKGLVLISDDLDHGSLRLFSDHPDLVQWNQKEDKSYRYQLQVNLKGNHRGITKLEDDIVEIEFSLY